ncbi:hypothetical protein K4K49_011309 [Colletotrichum sp. SAR 10_70]|nr:hypothetical protein K4K49_011309 [Colletotrichum sp. SAR 10_70]KAI8212454.1 hypothetical protein K4K53_011631 [Colletotrichum sp. SAR 10_77]
MGYQRYRGKLKDVPPPLSRRGFDYYGAESQLAIDALEKAIAQARRYTAKTPRQLPPGESQYHVVSKGKYLGVFTSHSQVIDSVNGVSGARLIELDAGQEDTFTSSPMTIQSFNFSPTKPIDPVSSPPAHSSSEIDTSKLLNGSDIAEVNVEGTPRQPRKRGRRPKSAAKPNGEVTEVNVERTPRQPRKVGRPLKSAAKPNGEVTEVNVEGTPRQPRKVGRPRKSTTQAKAQGSATGPVEDRRHRISKSEPKSSPSLAQKTLTAMFKPTNPK